MLLGGHTVRDPEIKFGYAITGLVDVDQMMTNAAGRAGDVLVLTKPLGTGIVATALKAGSAPEAAVAAATQSMAQLNRDPVRDRGRATACAPPPTSPASGWPATPWAIARESGLTLEIRAAGAAAAAAALELAPSFQPGGLNANRRQFGPHVRFAAPEPEPPCRRWSSIPRPPGACCSWCRRRTATPCSPSCPTPARSASRARAGDHPIVVALRPRNLAAGRAPC